MKKFLDRLACSIFISGILGCLYAVIWACVHEPMFKWAFVWVISMIGLLWSGFRLQDMIGRKNV